MRDETRANDYDYIEVLGRGGFGMVFKVRHKRTGVYYAVKIADATQVHKDNRPTDESDLLRELSPHPFIVNYVDSFAVDGYMFLVMELVNCGTLAAEGKSRQWNYHIQKKYKSPEPFDEETARFYLSEIVLALERMHERDIVYRDLKPDNVLFDEQGHIKLCDMGLAFRQTNRRVQATIGAIGYRAPEMLALREKAKKMPKVFSHNQIAQMGGGAAGAGSGRGAKGTLMHDKGDVSPLGSSIQSGEKGAGGGGVGVGGGRLEVAVGGDKDAHDGKSERTEESTKPLGDDSVGVSKGHGSDSNSPHHQHEEKSGSRSVLSALNFSALKRLRSKHPQGGAAGAGGGGGGLRKTHSSVDVKQLERSEGYGKEIDVWNLGVIMYIMLVGQHPFQNKTNALLAMFGDGGSREDLRRMQKGVKPVSSLSPNANALLHLLLHPDPALRPDLPKVKAHPFFHNVDWEAVMGRVGPGRIVPVKLRQREEKGDGEVSEMEPQQQQQQQQQQQEQEMKQLSPQRASPVVSPAPAPAAAASPGLTRTPTQNRLHLMAAQSAGLGTQTQTTQTQTQTQTQSSQAQESDLVRGPSGHISLVRQQSQESQQSRSGLGGPDDDDNEEDSRALQLQLQLQMQMQGPGGIQPRPDPYAEPAFSSPGGPLDVGALPRSETQLGSPSGSAIGERPRWKNVHEVLDYVARKTGKKDEDPLKEAVQNLAHIGFI